MRTNHNNKHSIWLAATLVVALAISRWPGLMPQNFSAVYAVVFCSAIFLPRHLAWTVPFIALFLSDVALSVYYHVQGFEVFAPGQLLLMGGNYLSYLCILILGFAVGRGAWKSKRSRSGFWPRLASWLAICFGSLLGAALFYLITNTLAWFFNPFQNPEYFKTWQGWIRALTEGTAGYPKTWLFFKHTLGSSGLFAGLFAAAMHLADATETEEEPEEESDPVEVSEGEKEEAPA